VAAELGDAAADVHLDVTDRGQWARAVSAAVRRFGKLNVLVNNAGIATAGTIGTYTPQRWDTIIAVNLTGVFNGTNASLEALKDAAPSSIINVSSTAGLQGYSKLPGYNASKFGVRGLTKSVALDLAAHDVRCNSVHPGAVTTPMTAGLDAPQQHVAMRRLARSEEISNLIVFLASDESSFSIRGGIRRRRRRNSRPGSEPVAGLLLILRRSLVVIEAGSGGACPPDGANRLCVKFRLAPWVDLPTRPHGEESLDGLPELFGGAGNDILDAGAGGNDILSGQAGNDRPLDHDRLDGCGVPPTSRQ
jgi:3alpha(or 20beta)-hydroxysteroid dehydrogenase